MAIFKLIVLVINALLESFHGHTTSLEVHLMYVTPGATLIRPVQKEALDPRPTRRFAKRVVTRKRLAAAAAAAAPP